MADKKQPAITIPDLKHEGENKGNALYVIRLVQQPVLPQDAYSPNEIAHLLGISKKRVYAYATSPRNPLPLRKWPNGARGSFALRDELIEWLRGSTVLPEECEPAIQDRRIKSKRLRKCVAKIVKSLFKASVFSVGNALLHQAIRFLAGYICG